jgi:hypothetical protein
MVCTHTDVQRINHFPDTKGPDPSRAPIITGGENGNIKITFQSPTDALDQEKAAEAVGFDMFSDTSRKPAPDLNPSSNLPLPLNSQSTTN